MGNFPELKLATLRDDIRNKKPGIEKTLIDMKDDFTNHLKRKSGNMTNYCGKYGKKAIQLAIENFPELFDTDEFEAIIEEKVLRLMDRLTDHVLEAEEIKVTADTFTTVVKYLKGKDESSDSVDKTVNIVISSTMEGNAGVLKPDTKN
ncbi:MAG: hypothetical protein AB7U45_03845 [Desulfamplus sp.]